MATVLVLLDHAETGALRGSVLELATAARDLADGGEVHGLWVGDEPVDPALPVLGRHGVAVVHQVSTGAVDPRLTPVLGEVLADAVRETGATVLLALSTFENKEAAARLAVATGAGVVTDAAAVERDAEGRVVASKTVLAGTWTTRCAVRTDLAVVLLKAGAVVSRHVDEEAPLAPEVRTRALAVSERATRAALVRRTPAAPSDRPDLSSADVVVVGGRGTEGDFAPIEALADEVGGAVGATRVATDEGWIGHETQIGQTGVTVSPRLYIGAGVSGAVHHRGGMQASGTIVAVNPDPEAPIFEIADYGIVGDLFTVLPQVTEELRRLRQG
ncbi:electron transfer flavoprotein subunit alpha/FixB family protein [Cellulomonas sp. IC4_254]|uniref:electron transfer flavoprotein subunit alpha/FixB family protein n=1 Tax=Cellulomonas sp. IC4_254 TaxID=2714040 RepID=UPI00141D9430|nr:electron transfer flavoprotein subunit alpha/FixB family protein [Cellulomonas sp. IC4_254]NHT18528.1 electron transfer flavoprotein subunit alpha/FixB family protein [Cellulomonas sp. IC4_254]